MKKLLSAAICTSFLFTSVFFSFNSVNYVSAAEKADTESSASEAKPTEKPKATQKPTPKPTSKPTVKPTVKPVVKVTPKATVKPTPKATTKPVASTKPIYTPKATVKPTAIPTSSPSVTVSPTAAPVAYRDGVYTSYGDAYTKGTEGAKVTIENGKVKNVEFFRTTAALIDRNPGENYKTLWNAYEPMKQRILGKSREEVAKVDIVSGATRSTTGWKLSVDRAFERASVKKHTDHIYFEGEHMGVDPQSKYAVFARFDKTKLVGIKVYKFNPAGTSLIDDASLTPDQVKATYTLANELLYRGKKAQPIKGYESEFKPVMSAFEDAEKNAMVKYSPTHIDGYYSAYGDGRDKGVEKAEIIIRNDKLVSVKLYRLGADLLDRGATAYASVVAANAPMTTKLLEKGSYIKKYNDKVDMISGATESSHGWNTAVKRAFEKAAKVKSKNKFYNGTFNGVDNKAKVLLMVNFENDKVKKVTSYLFDNARKLISATALTAEQKTFLETINNQLLEKGENITDIKGQEVLSAAARNAFIDAKANASKLQGKYKDGVFTAYGNAYDKGSNRADVNLRNGNIVAINLYRVGVNLVDRAAAAYAEVIKAIPVLTNAFMDATTKDKAEKVDIVSGATSSSNEFKTAVQRAFTKAEIVKSSKVAYPDGIFVGVDSAKTASVLITTEKNIPVKVQVLFLDTAGKVIADDKLSADQVSVKKEIEAPNTEPLHKYAYNAAAFGANDAQKAISAKVIEAIKSALTSALN